MILPASRSISTQVLPTIRSSIGTSLRQSFNTSLTLTALSIPLTGDKCRCPPAQREREAPAPAWILACSSYALKDGIHPNLLLSLDKLSNSSCGTSTCCAKLISTPLFSGSLRRRYNSPKQ